MYVHRPHRSIGAHFQHNSSPQCGSLQHLFPHLQCHCPSGSGLTQDIYLEKEDWGTNRWLEWHHWQWWLHPHHLHQPGPAHQYQCTDSEEDHCWRLPLLLQSWPQWTDCCEHSRCIPHQCHWWVDFVTYWPFVSLLTIFRSINLFSLGLRLVQSWVQYSNTTAITSELRTGST